MFCNSSNGSYWNRRRAETTEDKVYIYVLLFIDRLHVFCHVLTLNLSATSSNTDEQEYNENMDQYDHQDQYDDGDDDDFGLGLDIDECWNGTGEEWGQLILSLIMK